MSKQCGPYGPVFWFSPGSPANISPNVLCDDCASRNVPNHQAASLRINHLGLQNHQNVVQALCTLIWWPLPQLNFSQNILSKQSVLIVPEKSGLTITNPDNPELANCYLSLANWLSGLFAKSGRVMGLPGNKIHQISMRIHLY